MVMVVSVSWLWPRLVIRSNCCVSNTRWRPRCPASPSPRWPRTIPAPAWPVVWADTGTEEIESSGQEPSSSTGQSVSRENMKHCDSESTNANVLFLLQGVVPGYVCDFQEVALISPDLGLLSVSRGVIRSRYKSVKLGL